MQQIGFFEAMFNDIGARERAALNEAAHQLQLQDATAGHHSRSLDKLFALDRAQAEELTRLRLLVEIMGNMLVEAKQLDGQVLRDRLDDKLRLIEEAKQPKAPAAAQDAHPYRGGAPAPVAPPVLATTSCGRCGKEVFARDTQITGHGVVCDTCYYATE